MRKFDPTHLTYWEFEQVQVLHRYDKLLGLGEGLTNPHYKNPTSYEILQGASELAECREHGNEPLAE